MLREKKIMRRWVLFADGKLVVEKVGEECRLPQGECAPAAIVSECFSLCDDCEGGMIADDAVLGEGLQLMDLRTSYGYISHEEYILAGKGWELLFWDSHTRFCGDCGSKMRRHSAISKICSRCGREIFPQLSPAVLVLVRRGEEALLVHARNFKRPFYGLVAGFVETGESLEECVAREVMEETNLKVKNIKYFSSQAWPYPANLMIGFTADYESGEIKFADHELSDGAFFSRDNHPSIPPPPSLARTMIDSWLNER